MNVSTAVAPSSRSTADLFGGLAETYFGAGLAAYRLAKGGTSHAQNIRAAHDLAAVVFWNTPLGPLIKIHGEVVGAAGEALEGHIARGRLRRIKRNLAHAYRFKLGIGAGEAFAARYAASRVGLNPETVVPLEPPHATFVPERTVEYPGGKFITTPAHYRYSPNPLAAVAAATPYYDPELKAGTSEMSAIIKYGEGQQADLARQAYADALNRELASRPFPGAGLVPAPFAMTRR